MEEKYWKQFESSGRIEDYLSFVSSSKGDYKDQNPEAEQQSAEECIAEKSYIG